MFTKKIIDSDAFMDMPLSTQALYFHLAMRADDDGFINNPKKIQRMIGASDDDLKVLISKRFILTFDSGIIVVKHWRMHNYIRNDRYKPTDYIEERAMLDLKENGAYTELDTNGIPNGYRLDTQVSIGKDSLGEERVVVVEANEDGTDTDHVFELQHGSLGRGVVLLTTEQDEMLLDKLGFDGYNHYISKLANFIIEKDAHVANHYATILKWHREDTGL